MLPVAVNRAIAEGAFRARLTEMGATLLESGWLGSGKPHRVRCAAGHECQPRPNSVQQGGGICRVCARNDPATAEAAFRGRLGELGATLLEPAWRGSHKPHRVRCAAGHEYAPRPVNVRKGRGICQACLGRQPVQAEARFRARLNEIGATLLEPRWLGFLTPHAVRCANGHKCTPRPDHVKAGIGICRVCTGRDPATAEAAFRARLTELGASLLEPYRNGKTPHRVRCAAGHECRPTPKHIQEGNGICRLCAGRIWDVFYVVVDLDRHRLKFGVTSGDPRPRLQAHRPAGYREVVRLLTDLPGTVAPDLERSVLAALRLAGEQPINGREYYDSSALALVLDVVDHAETAL